MILSKDRFLRGRSFRRVWVQLDKLNEYLMIYLCVQFSSFHRYCSWVEKNRLPLKLCLIHCIQTTAHYRFVGGGVGLHSSGGRGCSGEAEHKGGQKRQGELLVSEDQ